MAVTWSQADVDALAAAIASGGIVQSMTFGEQTFTFRSVAEMKELLAMMQQAVNTAAGRSSTRYAATSKGC